MKTVYLAGPITGLTFDGCTDWREAVCKQFNPGIAGLSPMRAKEYLRTLGTMPDCVTQQSVVDPANIASALSSERGIQTRDYFDCTGADLVLANLLGAKKVSIGTVLEIAWCYASRTPLILVIEDEGNIHEHGMVRQCIGWRVNTLEAGVHVVNAVLSAYVGA